ncbi:MAG: hypothetical protein HY807_06715 [Nitrospirae bacterium]|nr:hypothetical protein [Nitrospirota bacterium]
MKNELNIFKRLMIKNILLFIATATLLSCASTNRNYAWVNSAPELHNQNVLNRDLAFCDEYSINASMGMPTTTQPSGYNIDYYNVGGIGYGSVTPKKTWGDSVAEIGMEIDKSSRKRSAFSNCMTSRGWSTEYADDSSGQEINGVGDGQGTMTWANGDVYVGQWKNDKLHGQGTKTWANGAKYVGQWNNSQMHGQGTYTWANGETYIGQWKNGLREGIGTHTYLNGKKDVGQWENNNFIK